MRGPKGQKQMRNAWATMIFGVGVYEIRLGFNYLSFFHTHTHTHAENLYLFICLLRFTYSFLFIFSYTKNFIEHFQRQDVILGSKNNIYKDDHPRDIERFVIFIFH